MFGRIVQIFGYRPGDRQPVKRRCAAADLIQQDQASRRGIVKNRRGLGHFDHKCRASRGKIVRRPDTRPYTVQYRKPGGSRGHERTDLRQYLDQGDLPEDGRFSAHIRAGDDQQPVGRVIHIDIVRDERIAEKCLDDRMAAVLDLDLVTVVKRRAT